MTSPRRDTLTLLLAGLLVGAEVLADPDPVPMFLPPTSGSQSVVAEGQRRDGPKSKKSRRVSDASPALRPTLATLVNVHTLEAIAIGPDASRDEPDLIARLLRDRTTWEEHTIAPECVRAIRAMVVMFNARRVEFISGYRSDKLNEHLRKKGRHVAQRSQHVLGHATDFRLVGVPVQAVLRQLRVSHNGGVGFYPQSGFIHVDAGARRRWAGS